MNIYLKYNIEQICRAIMHEKVGALNVEYNVTASGSIYFPEGLCPKKLNALTLEFEKYGIEIITNSKEVMVQKIKSLITTMLAPESSMPLIKMSSYLADSLDENYRTLSQIFNEVCHISIESFIILRKTELVKQLLLNENLSLTEISHRLQYSSVSHLSNQFKNSTGLTPSAFQKISYNKRKFNITLN